MKKRVARSEIQFYINGLLNRGYVKEGTEVTDKYHKQTLKKNGRTVTVCYTSNGWLSIT